MEQISGIVTGILFESPEGDYTVAKVNPEGHTGGGTEVLCGYMGQVNPGESIEAEGEWANHPVYGKNFKVSVVKTSVPMDKMGVTRFLTNMPHIGEKTAGLIWDDHGEDTLEEIKREPRVMLKYPGITEKRLPKIEKKLLELDEMKELYVFLESHKIGGALPAKIFKKWGAGSVHHIKENPYRLLGLKQVGFKTADRVALALGTNPESRRRLAAGLTYTLKSATEEGHTYLLEEEAVLKTSDALGVGTSVVRDTIDSLRGGGSVVIEDDRLYWKAIYEVERSTACCIREMTPRTGEYARKREEIIKRLAGTELSEEQIDGVRMSFESGVTCITGGPGTGKTLTLQKLASSAVNSGLEVCLGAPTGRAAQRMSEGTSLEGKTIHRLLEYKPHSDRFMRNRSNPLGCDLLIIDETSMLDIFLARRLTDAVLPGTHVVFFGDADQLPSVGPGKVFEEMIRGGVPTKRFEEIYRHGDGSEIARNARKINEGEFPDMGEPGEGEFFFVERSDPAEAARAVVELATDYIERKYWIPIEKTAVIAPMYRGIVGIDNLNQEIQAVLNPRRRYAVEKKMIKVGDKVLMTRNDYEKNVYNGDMGKVEWEDGEGGRVGVRFGDREVVYKDKEVEDLTLSYVMSIHKSQGSEFEAVVIPLMKSHYIMLDRNLLYTGVSRGKRVVAIVGSKQAVALAVNRTNHRERNTTLAKRIRGA